MKINLRVWMVVKVVPALLLLLFFHLVVTGNNIDSNVFSSLSLLVLVLLKIVKKFWVESTDERSKDIFQKIDALCYKVCLLMIVIEIFPFLFLDSAVPLLVGYLLVGSICALTIFRSIGFIVLDKKGE